MAPWDDNGLTIGELVKTGNEALATAVEDLLRDPRFGCQMSIEDAIDECRFEEQVFTRPTFRSLRPGFSEMKEKFKKCLANFRVVGVSSQGISLIGWNVTPRGPNGELVLEASLLGHGLMDSEDDSWNATALDFDEDDLSVPGNTFVNYALKHGFDKISK